jgi:6-phosphogluconolactonase
VRLIRRSAAGKTTHIVSRRQIGTAVLRAAGAHPRRADIDWSLVHIWWGDEVFRPAGRPRAQRRAARAALSTTSTSPAERPRDGGQ